ncbi:MAG: glycerol dehydratase reactivase beta/small subunit family protein [Syntrophales bacterium]|nr:glycerol dehydratase reactivase beta/small subunit family protein [Syntrophales bacterium]
MILPPAIWINKTRSVSTESIQPVLWGLEEEGIPFKINEASSGSMTDFAKQAADSSPLRVGIGIGGSGEVVLHHHDLPAGSPLFRLSTKPWDPVRLRRMGINAARLVKGQPLVIGKEGVSPAGIEDSIGNPEEETEELIRMIVTEVLKEYAA